MSLKKILISSFLLSILLSMAYGSETGIHIDHPIHNATKRISISSRGLDVREVLFDLFEKSAINFVYESAIQRPLFLNLKDIELEEALSIVCRVSSLEYRLQDGIFFIRPKRTALTRSAAPPKGEESKDMPSEISKIDSKKSMLSDANSVADLTSSKIEPSKKISGKLPEELLKKRIVLDLKNATLSNVLNALAQQTGIMIELNPEVPTFRLDAVLNQTTFKDAMKMLTEQTGLEYVLTDRMSVLIRRPANQ